MIFRPGLKALNVGPYSEMVQDDQVSMIFDDLSLDSDDCHTERVVQRTGWIEFNMQADPEGSISAFALEIIGHLSIVGSIKAVMLVTINGEPHLAPLPSGVDSGVDSDADAAEGLVVNPPDDPHRIHALLLGQLPSDCESVLLGLTMMLISVEPAADDDTLFTVDTLALNVNPQGVAAR